MEEKKPSKTNWGQEVEREGLRPLITWRGPFKQAPSVGRVRNTRQVWNSGYAEGRPARDPLLGSRAWVPPSKRQFPVAFYLPHQCSPPLAQMINIGGSSLANCFLFMFTKCIINSLDRSSS